jgi:hypothetical protein
MRPKPYPQVAYYDWATAEAAELDPAQWSIKARRRGRRFHSRGVPPPLSVLCRGIAGGDGL